MSTYTANIEIAVRGAQELKRLSDQIQSTSELVNNLNTYISKIGVGSSVRSIENLSRVVDEAAYAFRQAALGTNEATAAAQSYILATKQLNAGLTERVALLQQITEAERKQKLASAGIAEKTQYAGPIGPGAASPVALSSKLGNRLENIIKERQGAAELAVVLANLEEKDRLLSNSKLDAKALAIQTALDKEAAAVKKLTQEMEAASAASADFYSKGRLRQAAADAAYKQANKETYGYAGEVPALLPAGLKSAGAKMLNTVNDRMKQEAIITDLRKKDEKLFIQYKIDQIQRAYDIEIDEVGRLLTARIKADDAFWASNTKRWKAQNEQEVAARREKQKSNQRNESLALGVGFPLMFGAGPGMLAGSLAGSFVGSGFGGQILAGGVGQKLDEAAKAAADFSRSMREGGDAAGYLTEKLGYVNPETKKLIQNLQESGQTAEAAALAQRELGNAIGPNAVKDLKAYGDIWDYVGRKFQTFTLSVTANLPKLLAQTGAAVTGQSATLAAITAFGSAGLQKLGAVAAPKENPETKAATEKTKELRDQLTIVKANYTLSLQNATLDEKAYITAKAQTLQAQKTADYEKIIKDTKNGKLSSVQKLLEIQKLEVDYALKARDLDKERVQLLDQRNQVALAQAQAGMQVGILQQQVQLVREQNTASDARKASLQGQIAVQQTLNNLETINLQIAQERAKTQKDINQNKIKELEAQRNVANTQVNLAQAQAAQQIQQAQNSDLVKSLGVAKERYSLLLDYNNLGYKETEISKGVLQALKDKYDSLSKEAAVRRTILDIEQQMELLQRPDAANQINSVYALRRAILEKNLSIEKQITENQIKQTASAERMDMYRTRRAAATAIQGTARQITSAQIGIASFGMGEGQKAVLELENTQQQRRIDLQQQYADKFKELNELIMSSSGDALTNATQKLTIEQETYATQVQQLTVLDALEQKQLALNEITRQYGPLIGDISQSISQLMTQGVADLVAGTTTAQQVFSDFLKNVGDALMKAAQQMIAQYLAIAAAKALAGLFSGGSLGGAGGASNGSAFGGAAFGSGFDPGTSAAFGGMSIPGFAAGGTPPVGRPSLVGEQGPELFVPHASGTIIPADTTAAMARYQRQSSAPGSAAGGAAGDTGASPASWAMNFETTQFLGQDWVSKDQLMAAMAATEKRATAAGAKAGAQQVATKMRTSPAFRRQVGV